MKFYTVLISLIFITFSMGAMQEVDCSFTQEEYETFEDVMQVREIVIEQLNKAGGIAGNEQSAREREGEYFSDYYLLSPFARVDQGIAIYFETSSFVHSDEFPDSILTPWGLYRLVFVPLGNLRSTLIKTLHSALEIDTTDKGKTGFLRIKSARCQPLKKRERCQWSERDKNGNVLGKWLSMMKKYKEAEGEIETLKKSMVSRMGESMCENQRNTIKKALGMSDSDDDEATCLIL